MHVCCVSRFCWRMWIYIYTYTPVFTHLWWKANRTFYKCSTCSTITHTFLRNYCYKSTQTQCLVLFVHIFVFSQSAVHYEARNVARFHNTGQKFCNLSQKSHVTKLGLLVMHSQGCREKRGKGQQSRMTASLFLVSCLFFPFFFVLRLQEVRTCVTTLEVLWALINAVCALLTLRQLWWFHSSKMATCTRLSMLDFHHCYKCCVLCLLLVIRCENHSFIKYHDKEWNKAIIPCNFFFTIQPSFCPLSSH